MAGKPNKLNETKEEEGVSNSSALQLNALVSTILDYYETTEGEPLESGEEWKRLTEDSSVSRGVLVPDELDKELKKAFLAQIKKFQ